MIAIQKFLVYEGWKKPPLSKKGVKGAKHGKTAALILVPIQTSHETMERVSNLSRPHLSLSLSLWMWKLDQIISKTTSNVLGLCHCSGMEFSTGSSVSDPTSLEWKGSQKVLLEDEISQEVRVEWIHQGQKTGLSPLESASLYWVCSEHLSSQR